MTKGTSKGTKGRPKTLDVESLLDLATQAYWQADPADVSLNSVCHTAGVSKPSVYREFGNEDGLTLAVLDRYAERVLSEMFTLLQSQQGLHETLAALVEFACADPRMETGCLFYKMRAGKHRLGEQTRERVDAIDAAANNAYAQFLQSCREAGEWPGDLAVEAGATYLAEQVALAITQRASGVEVHRIRSMMTLALSVFKQA